MTVILFEFSVLVWVFRARRPVGRTSFHMLIYTFICLIVIYSLYLMPRNEDVAGRFWAEQITPGTTCMLFLSLFLIFLLAELSCNRSAKDGYAVDSIRASTARLYNPVLMISTFLPTFSFLHIISRNYDVLWSNTTYLLISSPDGGNPAFPASAFIASALPLVSILSFALLGITIRMRFWAPTFLLLLASMWCLVFSIASCSRTASISIAAYAVAAYALDKRRRMPLYFVSVLASAYLLQSALLGRGAGVFGLAYIGEILALPLSMQMDWIELILNIFQGAVITGDSLLIQGQHSWAYKVLSLSPFPSFVDRFDQIRDSAEIRLHQFVPMSGIGEAVRFGPIFWLPLSGAYILMVRYINSPALAAAIGGTPVAAANIVFSMFSVIAFAYPLRNTFRQLIYVVCCLLIIQHMGLGSRSPKSKGQLSARRPKIV